MTSHDTSHDTSSHTNHASTSSSPDDEGVIVRLATLDDAEGMLAVLKKAARPDADEEERARKGFVQGRMDLDSLKGWLNRPQAGGMIALVADTIVGVCMFAAVPETMPEDAPEDEPAQHPVQGLTRIIHEHDGIDAAAVRMFGPLAVDEDSASRGIGTKLVDAVATDAKDKGYAALASFVQLSNERSVGFHRHLGFEDIGHFDAKGSEYSVNYRATNQRD